MVSNFSSLFLFWLVSFLPIAIVSPMHNQNKTIVAGKCKGKPGGRVRYLQAIFNIIIES